MTPFPRPDYGQLTRYTPDRMQLAREEGNVVVVDFTAEWCINCKFLEATVLASEAFSHFELDSVDAPWDTIDTSVSNQITFGVAYILPQRARDSMA